MGPSAEMVHSQKKKIRGHLFCSEKDQTGARVGGWSREFWQKTTLFWQPSLR